MYYAWYNTTKETMLSHKRIQLYNGKFKMLKCIDARMLVPVIDFIKILPNVVFPKIIIIVKADLF